LIGAGRTADVFDIGAGRVLRRYRDAAAGEEQIGREAAVMRHLRANGYPVPEVHDVDGGAMVMERIVGVTMLDDLERHPWRVDRHADTWADMQRRLAAVPVGDMPTVLDTRFGPPDHIVHLDLHPDNIMLTPHGPVVIDWPNAAVGPAAADVAFGWVIGATTTAEGSWIRLVALVLRRRLVDRFVDSCGRAAALALLPAVAERRIADPNVRPEEAARVRALVAAVSSRP
jgi:aminoglycoside phosphotransferase (APT) family kinase protein